MFLTKYRFAATGKNIMYFPNSTFTFENISVGSNVYIGPNAYFASEHAKIKIASYVVFGPNVTIMGGDHNSSVIGRHIYEVTKKLPENDADVVIGEGAWIGANVTILKGVTISDGSIVGAGSVVVHSIPEYTIAVGNPAKVIKKRFSKKDLTKHKGIINSRKHDP